jgi:putative serine protease PepD
MTAADDSPGLGRPAGPDIRWVGPPGPPTSGATLAETTPPAVSHAPAAALAPTLTARTALRRVPLAAALALATLAGAASGAGVVAADQYWSTTPTSIVQERRAPNGGSGAATGTTEAAARAILPSVVQVRAGRGSGSGVIIDAAGHVLTNHHVVAGARTVALVLSTGRTVSAEVVGSDESNDIAVLRAAGGDLPAADLGVSADLRIGQPVIAVGSPLGLNGTVTSGVVSALERRSTAAAMIQTDASINPGNSGGPLVDLEGRVVGINTSIATLGGRSSGNIGIGFAVPIDRAAEVAQQILSRG